MEIIDLRLSDGSLVYSHASKTIRTNVGRSYGKWYWEVKLNSGSPAFYLGIANSTYPIGGSSIVDTSWRVGYGNNGYRYPENTSYSPAWVLGDVIGLYLDLDAGTLGFTRNGVDLGVAFSDIKTLGEVYPVIGAGGGNSRSAFINFGFTPFFYSPPNGYYAYGSAYSSKFLISSGDKLYSLLPNEFTLPLANNITTSSSTAGFEGWRVFDGIKDNSYWQTSTGTSGWLKCDFGSGNEKKIVSYRMYPSNNSINSRSPNSWTVEASSTGLFVGEETILDSQYDITGWLLGVAKNFYIENSGSFRFYRLNISKNNGATSLVNLGELELIAKGRLKELNIASENNFLKHGMGKDIAIDLSSSTEDKAFQNESFEVLGSGKVFKQIIDTTKIQIKKASIT
ncbi:hypothetical protein C161_09443 [Paenibacillus sp. FSL R5-192]|uniref:SPRY domain-containing protein n=1 Tax=Paenibacillus sp. FSL R5-192 TaxID=1226754 RepID=UPI0003E27EEB|nr:SPRY domain-containing protein [Paenibacillus sp. FSL R5-192]ETT36724.1 hypothetical protein C161_09443 [Paenibacillus sp. FSL R5-192]